MGGGGVLGRTRGPARRSRPGAVRDGERRYRRRCPAIPVRASPYRGGQTRIKDDDRSPASQNPIARNSRLLPETAAEWGQVRRSGTTRSGDLNPNSVALARYRLSNVRLSRPAAALNALFPDRNTILRRRRTCQTRIRYIVIKYHYGLPILVPECIGGPPDSGCPPVNSLESPPLTKSERTRHIPFGDSHYVNASE